MDLEKLKADHKEIYQAAFKEGVQSIDAAALTTEARTAERARFAAVMKHEHYQGRETTANTLLAGGGLSAEDIITVLATVPKAVPVAAGPSEFEKAMARENGLVNIGAGNPEASEGETEQELGAKTADVFQIHALKGVRP